MTQIFSWMFENRIFERSLGEDTCQRGVSEASEEIKLYKNDLKKNQLVLEVDEMK